MTSLFDAFDYDAAIQAWTDPNPAPVLEDHQGILVVRDDLLGVGTKARGADYLIGHDPNYTHVTDWVIGSCPATGYAQISLPAVCRRYNKRAHIFMAERDPAKYHDYQRRGLALGGDYHWVPNGMLSVTKARAREFVEAAPQSRMLIPMGLEHPAVFAAMARVARSLPVTPDYVWSVGSSGTLTRSLQRAWPNAEVHVVSTGHKMTEDERGRAILHTTRYKFDQPVKDAELPPFPSAREYDAKAWAPLREWFTTTRPTGTVLFWNVGA